MKNLFKKYWLIFAIIIFAAIIRFWRLGEPGNFYFDEVYHAFTAKEMVLGHHEAWEFWNTPPPGLAYEWSHPPLAKIFMAIGMKIFGIFSPFGWRFFGALAGIGNILLIYLIAKKLFREKVAIFAAFLLTFETLSFVQARIAMNDTYFLFFLLLAIYFLIRNQFLLSGFFWGFSLASKWTAIYFVFVLFFFFLYNKLKKNDVYLLLSMSILILLLIEYQHLFIFQPIFWNLIFFSIILFFIYFFLSKVKSPVKIVICFGILPFIIYFLSYLPFYFIPHPTLEQRIDRQSKVVIAIENVCPNLGFSQKICDNTAMIWNIQQQMYWYHTKLVATHPYQSMWYSWPFDTRPVYYSLETEDTKTSKIYAIGNPAIFLAGVLAIFYLLYLFFKRRDFKNGLVLVLYSAFFLPWAVSPRIMFIYHYLPAIPFLILGLSCVLAKFWAKEFGKIFVVCFLALVTLFFIYLYPHIASWPVSFSLDEQYYWFSSWR